MVTCKDIFVYPIVDLFDALLVRPVFIGLWGILVIGVNMAGCFFTFSIGGFYLGAMCLIMLFSYFMLIKYKGMSKLMVVPRILLFLPLLIYSAVYIGTYDLARDGQERIQDKKAQYIFVLTIIAVDGLCLIHDFVVLIIYGCKKDFRDVVQGPSTKRRLAEEEAQRLLDDEESGVSGTNPR
eukprot:Platyproteum_vivax@DN2759_c0_g1_i1.p1